MTDTVNFPSPKIRIRAGNFTYTDTNTLVETTFSWFFNTKDSPARYAKYTPLRSTLLISPTTQPDRLQDLLLFTPGYFKALLILEGDRTDISLGVPGDKVQVDHNTFIDPDKTG